MAHSKNYPRVQKPKPKNYNPAMRKCLALSCGRLFKSDAFGHRKCGKCAARSRAGSLSKNATAPVQYLPEM